MRYLEHFIRSWNPHSTSTAILALQIVPLWRICIHIKSHLLYRCHNKHSILLIHILILVILTVKWNHIFQFFQDWGIFSKLIVISILNVLLYLDFFIFIDHISFFHFALWIIMSLFNIFNLIKYCLGLSFLEIMIFGCIFHFTVLRKPFQWISVNHTFYNWI